MKGLRDSLRRALVPLLALVTAFVAAPRLIGWIRRVKVEANPAGRGSIAPGGRDAPPLSDSR